MIAVGAGAAHSWIEPVKVGLKPRDEAPPSGPQVVAPTPDPGGASAFNPDALGQMISLAEAKALYESGVLFLDSRPKEEFDKAHILGAYHLSTLEFDAGQAGELLEMLSPTTHYVLYCEGGECDASENLAQRLEDAFPLFHIMRDGFPAWEAAGYDIEVPEGGTP